MPIWYLDLMSAQMQDKLEYEGKKYSIKETTLSDLIKGEKAYGRASCDDYLDAYIAWYLGNQFLHDTSIHPVVLIGNVNTGSWLLPNIDNSLTSEFDKFIKENECE